MPSIIKHTILLLLSATLSFASIGKISALNGDVSITRDSKVVKAVAGTTLEQKDIVKSSKGSTAQIVFNDNTVITVGSATTFKVEEYLFDEKTPNAKFKVEEGSFKTITGKIGKIAPDKFKLETKTATIGIRGTVFVGKIDGEGNLKIACTKGAIVVTPNLPNIPNTPPPPPTLVPEGQMTNADKKGVEPPRTYTPGDLKDLGGDLGGYAKRGGSNNQGNGNQDNKDKPTFAANDVKEKVGDSTNQIINTIVNNQTSGGSDNQYGITPYASLPQSGVYTYVATKDGNDQKPGYIDFGLRNMFHSKLNMDSSGKIFSEYTWGYVEHHLLNPDNSPEVLNASLYAKSWGYDNGGTYTDTNLYDETAYFRGSSGQYLNVTMSNDVNATQTTNLVRSGLVASPWASGYGADYVPLTKTGNIYDVGTGIYKATGTTVFFDTVKTLFDSGNSVIDTGGTDNTLSMKADVLNNTLTMYGTLGNSSLAPSCLNKTSIVGEDAFGSTLSGSVEGNSVDTSKSYIFTVADDGGSDYASWGYWQAMYSDASTGDRVRFGFWVAGVKTDSAFLGAIPNGTSYTYNGKSMGGVLDTNNAFDAIKMDSNNKVALTINFGATDSISGTIDFKTVKGELWNITVSPTNSVNRGSSSFSFTAATGTSAGSGTIVSGSATGNFYGSQAQSVGGSFSATNNNYYNAMGIFKANK